MKIQRFYSSIDQKIDFCQDHLLTETVPFRAYYTKKRVARRAPGFVRERHIFLEFKERRRTILTFSRR